MDLDNLFKLLEATVKDGGQADMALYMKNIQYEGKSEPQILLILVRNICKAIDNILSILNVDETVLISVKNQKILRTGFQLITTLGICPCLLPGLGIPLLKRCKTSELMKSVSLNDNEKYNLLVECTEFFTRSYEASALKNIILTFHFSDYLAALFQLCFAPLKKPGTYPNYVMTPEMHEKLLLDRKRFIQIYDNLVTNCFQPTLIKELLVLQSSTDPSPPAFARKAISKELSNRLLSQRGLLSLIRCFIDSYEPDVGCEWKKTEMVCKIIISKHGNGSETEYLNNMCNQLTHLFQLNNTNYYPTAVACALALYEKYPKTNSVMNMVKEIFQPFDIDFMCTKFNFPGTVAYSSQEVENKLNILEACVQSVKVEWPVEKVSKNIYLLFQLGVKSENISTKKKVVAIISKIFEKLSNTQIISHMEEMLFGLKVKPKLYYAIDIYEIGPIIKCISDCQQYEYNINEATNFFIQLIKESNEIDFLKAVFEASLSMVMDLTKLRLYEKPNHSVTAADDIEILNRTTRQYATMLHILTEISSLPNILPLLKSDPSFILGFIEFFLINNKQTMYDDCVSMAIVLLNVILSESSKEVHERCRALIPLLRNIAADKANLNSVLAEEALNILTLTKPKVESACEKAISEVFDNLLPVRAHGIIELTKLINNKDQDTLSKKHYVFCLLQNQLKDPDTYIYLSAINGISALGVHCTEEVLGVLCQEYLQMSQPIAGTETENQIAETRMKIGDAIVKVTKGLGDMAVVHKTLLLNTVLCACRDVDPLVRASALSNLAEIARVLHYRMGSIIYEVLLCVWNIIESDKAVECRRAAVMVISSLLKGLGKDTIEQLKDNLLPIYRTLKKLYNDEAEDDVVRLHAQIALEELNDTVTQALFPEVKVEKNIFILKQ